MIGRLGKRRVLVVGIAIVGSLGAFVGGALAVHDFTDVPTNAFYHDDVSWLADNNITAGCGGGKYCPNNAVTRGQMAVFLHNLVSRTNTGYESCNAREFLPPQNTVGYAMLNDYRYGSGVNAQFDCPVDLPHGATVTRVAVAVRDVDAAASITCNLLRYNALDQGLNIMAIPPTSTGSTPPELLTTTTISFSEVDNSLYVYMVACTLGTNSDRGVYGAVVEYQTAGVPAP